MEWRQSSGFGPAHTLSMYGLPPGLPPGTSSGRPFVHLNPFATWHPFEIASFDTLRYNTNLTESGLICRTSWRQTHNTCVRMNQRMNVNVLS